MDESYILNDEQRNRDPIVQKHNFTHQLSSATQSCPMDCSTPGFPVHHQLPELAQTHVHRVSMSSNHLIPCYPLLLLPSIFPSIRVFLQRLSSLHQVPKVLELQHPSFQ